MNESEEVHVIGKKCFVCQKKQCKIIVKMIINEFGVEVKSQNRMTYCRNKDCHRYQKDLPKGWIYESIETYEREQNKILNSWKPRRYTRRKSNTKDQSDETSELDTEGEKIRSVEAIRNEQLSKRHAWNGESIMDIKKHGTLGEAFEDTKEPESGDEHSDLLE